MTSFQNSSFLIIGLARNCEALIAESVATLAESFSSVKSLRFLVIESDSSDRTVEVLCRLATENNFFNYVSLGHLRSQYPKRTDRIAFCRNYYLKLINACSEYKVVDYVVVADLDGVNSKLSIVSVASCWSRTDWDVCTANQDGPYYDIWALRHPLWSPNDCWEQVRMMQSLGLGRFKSNYISVLARMIRIPVNHDWIEVNSAFGGLAIYRKSVLKHVRYEGLNTQSEEVCEHVSLHRQIRSNGGKIFVNPALINATIIEHALSSTFLGLIKFWLQCQVVDLLHVLGLHTFFRQEKKSMI